jgi:hypothetical protein
MKGLKDHMGMCWILLPVIMLLGFRAGETQSFIPAGNRTGPDSLHSDDPVFSSWAVRCTVERGPGLITIPDSIEVTSGKAEDATGMAGDGLVVSLGDGGTATLFFNEPLADGPGPDFAVFENSFDGKFLELAFVEVSSDDRTFVRFAALSLTDTAHQVGTFGTLDPGRIDKLAGKYKANWGTPFDLAEMKDEPLLDVRHITAVRIVDVIGILDDSLGSRDSRGRLINDPWPTPFPSGGFDLDAVGVINHADPSAVNHARTGAVQLYPNPCTREIWVNNLEEGNRQWILMNIQGKVLMQGELIPGKNRIRVEWIEEGVYYFRWEDKNSWQVNRILKLGAE